MKKLLLMLLAAALTGALQAAPLETEEQALATLQSSGPASEKEAACLLLKEIGTAKSVPALEALLANENFAQRALDALETMPAREAGKALLQALPKSSGNTKALVISALGARRETAAVRPLKKLLLESDHTLGAAAAQALGRIGGSSALAALRTARASTTRSVRRAVNNAILAIAEDYLAEGKVAKARALYAELHSANESQPLRIAAFRGLALCAGDGKVNMLVSALGGADEAEQAVAVQLVRELPGELAEKAFAAALPKSSPLVQVALLEALRQRGEPALASVVAALTHAGESSVRVAAIRTLGELGDASHVGLLVQLAATGSADERSEAQEALSSLHRGKIVEGIISEIQNAQTEVKIELIGALARRMDRQATPELLRLAASEDSKLSLAAIKALEKLADESQAVALLDLTLHARDNARREAAVSAFVNVGGHSRKSAEFSSLALQSAAGAIPEIRCSLLEAAGQIGGPGVLDALRAALKDSDADIRATALRALAENMGDEARPDLLKLAQELPLPTDHAQALQGYWRLVEGMAERSQVERLAAVRDGLSAAKTAADRKLGLARLADLRGKEALELTQQYRSDAAVRTEAETACLQIVTRLDAAQLTTAKAVLRDLADVAESPRVRDEAKAASAKLEAQEGCIAPWLVCGPFRQEGKNAQQLFDVAFEPETADSGKEKWQPISGGTGLTDYWKLDLLPVAKGDQCVVYLKTRVFCPKEQPVALEIGSDDGVKLWINGVLSHANNAVRGFTPGEDKAKGMLKEGWNDFLVKITQSTAGCAAAVRVRGADGTAIPGLRVEAPE